MKFSGFPFTIIFLFFALCISCVEYNPSFADLVKDGVSDELKKGFFEYNITFPQNLGTEVYSRMTLCPEKGGDDVLVLQPGWMDNAPVFPIGNEDYRRLQSAPGANKIFYGTYKLTIIIANPMSILAREKTIWIAPGKTGKYTEAFTAEDFIRY